MKISIIIPCYNNEGSIPILTSRLLEVIEDKVFNDHSLAVVFVDDGSEDNTLAELQSAKRSLPDAKIVKLSRNFGSYNSFLAGMTHSSGDVHVYLHADLQDPPELIIDMFREYVKGIKLVIANRESRADSNIFSNLYHKMMLKFGIKKIPKGGFDLIMFHEEIREKIVKIAEKNTNQVYLISWLGYPYVNIPYKREARKHGKSQWSFTKKAQLFIDTILSFTRIAIWMLRLASLAIWAVTIWKSILAVLKTRTEDLTLLWIVSLLSLMLLIIGEYLERVHESVRNRPNFIVDEIEE